MTCLNITLRINVCLTFSSHISIWCLRLLTFWNIYFDNFTCLYLHWETFSLYIILWIILTARLFYKKIFFTKGIFLCKDKNCIFILSITNKVIAWISLNLRLLKNICTSKNWNDCYERIVYRCKVYYECNFDSITILVRRTMVFQKVRF